MAMMCFCKFYPFCVTLGSMLKIRTCVFLISLTGAIVAPLRTSQFWVSKRHPSDTAGMYIYIYIYTYIPASSKGFCLNPKGWCIGTPYHPFGTPWKIQEYISHQ